MCKLQGRSLLRPSGATARPHSPKASACREFAHSIGCCGLRTQTATHSPVANATPSVTVRKLPSGRSPAASAVSLHILLQPPVAPSGAMRFAEQTALRTRNVQTAGTIFVAPFGRNSAAALAKGERVPGVCAQHRLLWFANANRNAFACGECDTLRNSAQTPQRTAKRSALIG